MKKIKEIILTNDLKFYLKILKNDISRKVINIQINNFKKKINI